MQTTFPWYYSGGLIACCLPISGCAIYQAMHPEIYAFLARDEAVLDQGINILFGCLSAIAMLRILGYEIKRWTKPGTAPRIPPLRTEFSLPKSSVT